MTPTGADNVELLLQLAACADLSDSLERLTCYDRLAGEYGLSGYVLADFRLAHSARLRNRCTGVGRANISPRHAR